MVYMGFCLARFLAIPPVEVRQIKRSTLLSRAICVAVEQRMSVVLAYFPSFSLTDLASSNAFS